MSTRQRHDSIDAPAADPVAARVHDAAAHLLKDMGEQRPAASLQAVAAAQELAVATNEALQAAVDRARAFGHSWRAIGGVLGTTRQAAFQRFGRPIDPRTGEPLRRAAPVPDAEARAAALVSRLAKGRWEEARQALSAPMRERLDAERLARGWAQTVAEIGSYEGMGEPLVHQAGEGTAVDIPLYFEAGERIARVAFSRDGQIVGLFLRPYSL